MALQNAGFGLFNLVTSRVPLPDARSRAPGDTIEHFSEFCISPGFDRVLYFPVNFLLFALCFYVYNFFNEQRTIRSL